MSEGEGAYAVGDKNQPNHPNPTDDQWSEDDDDDIKQSVNDIKNDAFPVWPLIIPNNCDYDPKSGKMSVNHHKKRTKLMPYKPALDFIRNIKSKVATISIVGKARTGKSLVAGELYAPQRIPCPFDLGHKMDACTYGIWVSAKPIKHPKEKDTVILIFDVEGNDFHQNTKQNDMQLMVMALLISSYFIYNSKGTFKASCIEEIQFITELTQTIQSTPNGTDNTGEDFKTFFPTFMWLLRDVHLEPTLNGTPCSIRKYFTKTVLKKETGYSEGAMTRNQIRLMLKGFFQKYDAFTLPIPTTSDKLSKINDIPRENLQKAFVDGLTKFYDKVMMATKCKTLFIKEGGSGQLIDCTGDHLAGLIEQSVEAVNNPNKVPNMSSMTEAIMGNYYKESREKAMEEYKKLLKWGLNKLRNNDDKQPLDEHVIIDLHLKIYNHVLNSSGKAIFPSEIPDDYNQEIKNNDGLSLQQQQIKVFKEFCDKIGHSIVTEQIGRNGGILYDILNKNSELSDEYCDKWLDSQFMENISPLLQNPNNEAETVSAKFKELEGNYFNQCKGPAKDKCWRQFKFKRLTDSMALFKRLKGVNDELLKRQKQDADKREEVRQLRIELESEKKMREQQIKSLNDVINNITRAQRENVKTFTHAIQQKDENHTKIMQLKKEKHKRDLKKLTSFLNVWQKIKLQKESKSSTMLKEVINDDLKKEQIKQKKSNSNGCFGGNNKCYRIKIKSGEIEMCHVKDICLGDWILTQSGNYKCVIHVDHYNYDKLLDMICIEYEGYNGNNSGNIIMTNHHYIYIKDSSLNKLQCVRSSQVKIGDTLKYMDINGDEGFVKVINVESCREYASSVMTSDGSMVVSNVAASCFTINTINLSKYLWIAPIMVNYTPIKCAEIVSSCFYYTNKCSKWIVAKYKQYFIQ